MQSCPVGNGFICEGARTECYGPDDAGNVRGSSAGALDIFDQGTHNQHAIRFYQAELTSDRDCVPVDPGLEAELEHLTPLTLPDSLVQVLARPIRSTLPRSQPPHGH